MKYFKHSILFFLLASATIICAQTTNNNVSHAVSDGFSGNYTIGSSEGADFSNFSDAIAAMQGGIVGAVHFSVEAGVYTESIRVVGIQGTSAENTIVFSAASGNNNDVVITGGYFHSTYGMAAVDNTEYVTFENMSFIPSSQNYGIIISLHNMSRHFTLRNCIVTAEPVTTGSSGISLIKTIANNVEGQNNDFCTIENNTFTGGYIALYLGGTSYVALSKEQGLIVKNNTIVNAGSKGIYVTDEENVLIENNFISTSQTTKTAYVGIDLFRNRGEIIVRNNTIVNSQSVYSTGINLRQESMGTAELPALVYNNSIAITASKSSGYGIDISSDCQYLNLYHNSINLNGTGGYAFGISKTYSTISNIVLKNNLFQNNTSGPIYFFRPASAAHLSACSFSNNAYYSTNGAISNSHSDLGTWNTASGETNAALEQAFFTSASDLHLVQAGSLNIGLPLSDVTTDADGLSRSTINTTVGAYEKGNTPTSDNRPSVDLKDGFYIYPNPVRDIAYIDTNIDFRSLKIHSIQGKLILNKTDISNENSIDMSDLPVGNYIISLFDKSGKSYSTQFVKKIN